MIRVGWLADVGSYIGGAERTHSEFAAAAPEGVEIVPCPPGNVVPDCDRYAVHNAITYSLADVQIATRRRTVKYHNDVGSWMNPEVRAELDANAIPVCCSPLQADYMRLDAVCIPPPINLQPFYDAASRVNGSRRGVCSVGSWRNYGKGAHRVMEWAAQHGEVAFFGDGMFAPPGSREVAYEEMPALLAGYSTFVHLPVVIEPFGRAVVEAWAAGASLVINDLVGARYWITEAPEKLDTAAESFWHLVLDGS